MARPVFRKKRFGVMPGAPGGVSALVTGLGNPGERYRQTRHNTGFMAADKLLESSSVGRESQTPQGVVSLAESGGVRFLVLKPWTYMNLSGKAVLAAMKHYRLVPGQLVVVHDDIDIPAGEVRIKKNGGAGGHRGVASIIEALGAGDFTRVRIGVGRPPGGQDATQYVLSQLTRGELTDIEVSASIAAEKVLGVLAEMGRRPGGCKLDQEES